MKRLPLILVFWLLAMSLPAQEPELPLTFTNQFPCQLPGFLQLKKVQYLTFKARQATPTVYPDGIIPLKKIADHAEPRIPAMMEFDRKGNLLRVAVYQADGDSYRLSLFSHNEAGQTTKVVEKLRRLSFDAEAAYDSTLYRYTAQGQLDSIIPAPSGKLSRGEESRLIQRKKVVEYDTSGRIARMETYNWGGALQWSDPGPNLESVTRFDYDLQGRPVRKTEGDSLSHWEEVYTYDKKGRLFSDTRISPAGKKERIVSYVWDERGRIVYMKVQQLGKPTRTALFTYREDGLLHDYILKEEDRTLVNAYCDYLFFPSD